MTRQKQQDKKMDEKEYGTLKKLQKDKSRWKADRKWQTDGI